MRLSSNPHTVAAGCASGVAVSFTPFIGFHFIAAFIVAYIVRGNMLAAAIGTAAGNPLTFPLIWAATYELGQLMLGQTNGGAPPALSESLMEKSIGNIWPIIKPMLVGSIPLCLIAASVTYIAIYKLVSTYQKRKMGRMEKSAKIVATEDAPNDAAAIADDNPNGGQHNVSGG